MTLPGMPPRVGDPGVFVCGPADIAPWEREKTPRPALPQTAPGGVPRGVWLVLHLCPRCARIRNYCSDHRVDWAFRNRG